MSSAPTSLEKQSLEAHVDLCALRYQQLDDRLTSVEKKIATIHEDMRQGQNSLVKVIVGAATTIVAGLLTTVVTILMKF
jgi:tetrahydromethanopterin S-methyltransferase subunit G